MLQKTMEYMRQQKIELAGQKIVIGLSGGMDSVCLFHVLRDLGCELAAVHVNHCIRGEEADKDEAFVKETMGNADFQEVFQNTLTLSI